MKCFGVLPRCKNKAKFFVYESLLLCEACFLALAKNEMHANATQREIKRAANG